MPGERGVPLVWERKFKTEWKDLGTTGGTLWDAGFRMADFLESTGIIAGLTGGAAEAAGAARPRILELGSGCGWLGICMALNNRHADVVLTDQEAEGQLEWTQHNIDLSGVCGNGHANCSALPLDWVTGNPAVEGHEYALFIGSDLVYNEAGVDLLPALLRRLFARSPKAKFFYAHTRYRYEDSDMCFYRNLREQGLCVRECWAHGAASPPPSPRPMEEVFPEKRIAILEIQLQAGGEGVEEGVLPYRRASHSPTDCVVFGDSD